MAAFTVDTKLFQELGELLVAKESTALTELIKNAYDADATAVTVLGTSLSSANGTIVVSDDGSGMSKADFENGFLRIAGRTKVTVDRKSAVFGRRFTGEKGVGRLAAHKLARVVKIVSSKADAAPRGAIKLPPAISTVRASIDWDMVEELETLDQVAASQAVKVRTTDHEQGVSTRSGTTITMSPLRRAWTPRMIESFLREAVTLVPRPVLWTELPKGLATAPLLFRQLAVRDQSVADPGFRIDFGGDLAVPDVLSIDSPDAAGWIAELEYERGAGLLKVAVAPTARTIVDFPSARGFKFQKQLGPAVGPSFTARILQKSGAPWDPTVQGVRVFMEGFRIPPYGDATDDWLGLERDYRSRARRSLLSLTALDVRGLPEGDEKEQLVVQGNAAYMGAVYLHRSSSPELKMLANREGFLAGAGLDFIVEWVRVAIDLIVRLGYASRAPVKGIRREERKEERIRQQEIAERADVRESPSALRVRESALAAAAHLGTVRAAIDAGDLKAAAAAVKAAQPHIDDVRTLSGDFGSEAVMWRVLASLGTELAAFVHEINALAAEAGTIVNDLDEALLDISGKAALSKVRGARRAALALADRIRRNATYLVDATSFRGRRRRSRLPLKERFDAVLPFFQTRIEQRRIEIRNEIPEDFRTPPMFPAELAGIFTNLLSNAVKFSDDGGRIKVRAKIANDAMSVTVENSGAQVDLADATRWFEAFESTTERPDAVLGQGMGMGLTITRAFVKEYGGSIEFVPPSRGYATAVRFEIPAR